MTMNAIACHTVTHSVYIEVNLASSDKSSEARDEEAALMSDVQPATFYRRPPPLPNWVSRREISLLPSLHRTRTVRVAVEVAHTLTVFMQLTIVTAAVLNVPLAMAPYFAVQ